MKLENLINNICFSISLWLYLKDVNKKLDEAEHKLNDIERRIK